MMSGYSEVNLLAWYEKTTKESKFNESPLFVLIKEKAINDVNVVSLVMRIPSENINKSDNVQITQTVIFRAFPANKLILF
jgi:hypothetical protein